MADQEFVARIQWSVAPQPSDVEHLAVATRQAGGELHAFQLISEGGTAFIALSSREQTVRGVLDGLRAAAADVGAVEDVMVFPLGGAPSEREPGADPPSSGWLDQLLTSTLLRGAGQLTFADISAPARVCKRCGGVNGHNIDGYGCPNA